MRNGVIDGAINYLAESVQPSLRRNGRVLTRRDRDGSDSGSEGEVATRNVSISNARDSGCTCELNGFELLDAPRDPGVDFYDHESVVRAYYRDCAELVAETTGAATVVAFDHNIRSAAGKASKRRIKGGQEVQGPAHMVHGDYTLTSAPQRLTDLAQPPTGNDTLRVVLAEGETPVAPQLAKAALSGDTRYAIINVWRSIGPEAVTRNALALCDGRSVEPDDLVVFEIHYADRVGENYFARPADGHRWYSYPAMTAGEALLIKQWDSAGSLARTDGVDGDGTDATTPCTFSFHTAFEGAADGPDRESIEVRCMVIYR